MDEILYALVEEDKVTDVRKAVVLGQGDTLELFAGEKLYFFFRSTCDHLLLLIKPPRSCHQQKECEVDPPRFGSLPHFWRISGGCDILYRQTELEMSGILDK